MQNSGDAPLSAAVMAAIRSGHKIEAIKLLRDEHRGLSLAEAKDAVDRMADGRPSAVYGATAHPGNSGTHRVLQFALFGMALALVSVGYYFISGRR
jgi:hypothetical protein